MIWTLRWRCLGLTVFEPRIFVKGLNNIEKRILELAGPGLKFNVLSPEYELGHRNIWYTNVLHHRHQHQGISIPSLICVQGCRSHHLFLGRQTFILPIGVYSYSAWGMHGPSCVYLLLYTTVISFELWKFSFPLSHIHSFISHSIDLIQMWN